VEWHRLIKIGRPEIWILAVMFGIAALALAFGHIAEEVLEGGTLGCLAARHTLGTCIDDPTAKISGKGFGHALASFTSMQLESDSTNLGNPQRFNQPGKCSSCRA
jgi:hypothetical protein